MGWTRFPYGLGLAGTVLLVVLVGLLLLHASGTAWGAPLGAARLAPEALTPGQVAAIEGGNFLLSGERTPLLYLPLVQYPE